MATTSTDQFITRTEASKLCGRAERTLQRYWSKAVDHQDHQVLSYLRLRTKDDQVTEGADVTKQLIEKLKKNGANPTWEARQTFVIETYGLRQVSSNEQREKGSDVTSVGDPQPATTVTNTKLVEQYESRIKELEQDKSDLRVENNVKNELIKELTERKREDNVLQKQNLELLKQLQERLLELPAASATIDASNKQTPTPNPVTSRPSQQRKRKQSHKSKSKPSVSTRRKRSATKKQPETFWKKHLPSIFDRT